MSVYIDPNGIRSLLLGVRVQTGSVPTANGETSIFTITGGRILVTSIVGEVTTAFGATTSNTKIVFDSAATSTDVDLCATADVASLAIGTLFSITGDFSDALKPMANGALETDAVLERPIVLKDGAIHVNSSADAGVGAYHVTITYIPLDDDARVTAVL